jgi:hypothetical protein
MILRLVFCLTFMLFANGEGVGRKYKSILEGLGIFDEKKD